MQDTDVGQLMTEPVLTVEPEALVDEIADAMLQEGIKSIVAIDDDCEPIGILTSTDFVDIVAQGTPKTKTTVGDHMTTDIITTATDVPIPRVASRMVEHDISHIPVVDKDGTAIGIISATDLTDYVAGMAVREPSE
ncbi:MAG: CBS domain-containing protein [Natronomonas sp.]|jgi:CBS domain-containing protein|uniref:CBS domain-containing protein n=1 Tax=Natronomonas sp. TaxID=2184060 RepID=UPI003988F748